MQAVLLTGHGGLEKLVVVDNHLVPVPTSGEVLIEVTACGMNNTDVWVREGAYGTDDDPDATATWRRGHKSTLEFPRIQGTDTVGRIVAVGAGVDSKRTGAIAGPNVQLDLRTIYLKHLEMHGSSQGTRACFRKLVDLIEADKLKPLLADTYPLSRFHEAQKAFMLKAHFGNIVVQPDAKWQAIS